MQTLGLEGQTRSNMQDETQASSENLDTSSYKDQSLQVNALTSSRACFGGVQQDRNAVIEALIRMHNDIISKHKEL